MPTCWYCNACSIKFFAAPYAVYTETSGDRRGRENGLVVDESDGSPAVHDEPVEDAMREMITMTIILCQTKPLCCRLILWSWWM